MSIILVAVASVSATNGPTGMIPALLINTVQRAEPGLDLIKEIREARAVGDVERQPDRSTAQLLRGPLGERGLDVADRQLRALRDQGRGSRATDTAGPARDGYDLTGERSCNFGHEQSSSW